MKKTKTLILGATAFACGLSGVLTDFIVASEDTSPGGEFADAMVNHPVDVKSLGAAGKGIADELVSRGCLDDSGRIHILALSGVFAKRFYDSGREILFSTFPVSIERTSDGFLTTLFSSVDGYIQVLSERVIDTRADDSDLHGAKKTFGLMLSGSVDPGKISGAKVTRGYFDDEYVLRFEVPAEFSVPDAEKFADGWLRENHSSLGGAKAAAIALRFGYESASPIDYTKDGVRHIVSASYPDALTAFDRGASFC